MLKIVDMKGRCPKGRHKQRRP